MGKTFVQLKAILAWFAASRRLESMKRGATICTPTGSPFSPKKPGKDIAGTCKTLHIRWKTASPVVSKLSGAIPGAPIETIPSKSLAMLSNSFRHPAA